MFRPPGQKGAAAPVGIRDYGGIPGSYAAGLYTNGQVAEALEQTGGRTDDKEALITAMRAVSLTDTPRGPFHFDHFGNVVGDFFIRRCERKDGKLVNTTIKTYRAVSQFWSYDETWFLSQPVYSRDCPPLKAASGPTMKSTWSRSISSCAFVLAPAGLPPVSAMINSAVRPASLSPRCLRNSETPVPSGSRLAPAARS
jgi:hypothetical protein